MDKMNNIYKELNLDINNTKKGSDQIPEANKDSDVKIQQVTQQSEKEPTPATTQVAEEQKALKSGGDDKADEEEGILDKFAQPVKKIK